MDGGSWHCTSDSDQDHPPEKEMEKGKMVAWQALQIAVKRRELKAKEKRKHIPIWIRVPRIARRDKKAFLSDQWKEIKEDNRMGKTRDLFKKFRDTKGIFHAKMSTIKDRNGMDLTEAKDIKKRYKNTPKNCTKKISMTQIITMVWSLT